MRITIEGATSRFNDVERELTADCKELVHIEVVAKGEKASLAGEPQFFVTMIAHYSGDLAVGLLAHYLYDLVTKQKAAVKVSGRDIANLDEPEIRAALGENGSRSESVAIQDSGTKP